MFFFCNLVYAVEVPRFFQLFLPSTVCGRQSACWFAESETKSQANHDAHYTIGRHVAAVLFSSGVLCNVGLTLVRHANVHILA